MVSNVLSHVAGDCRRSPSSWTMGLIRFYVLSRVDVSSEDLGYTDYWAMRKACRYNALESGYAPAMSSSACRLLMKRFSSLHDFRDLPESMWRPGGAASGHPVVLGSAEQEAKRFLQRKLMAKGVDEWSRPPPPGVAGERLSDLLRQHQRQGREVVGHGRLPMRDPDYLAPGRGWAAPGGTLNGVPHDLPVFGLVPTVLRRAIHSVDGGTRWRGGVDVAASYEGMVVLWCLAGRGVVSGKLTFVLLIPGPIARHFWYGPHGTLLRDSHLFLKFRVASGGGLYHADEVPWSLKSDYFRSLHARAEMMSEKVGVRKSGRYRQYSPLCCTSCLLTGK